MLGLDLDTLSGKLMHQRRAFLASQSKDDPVLTASGVPDAVGSSDAAEILERLADLHHKGILTNDEFQKKKSEILSRL
jgi:hypothetical protein